MNNLSPEVQEQVRAKIAENVSKDAALAKPVIESWPATRDAMMKFIADARSRPGQQTAGRMTSVISLMRGVIDALEALTPADVED